MIVTKLEPNGVGSLVVDVFYEMNEANPHTPRTPHRDSTDSRNQTTGTVEYLGFIVLPLAPVWHFFPHEGRTIVSRVCSDKAEISFKVRSFIVEESDGA